MAKDYTDDPLNRVRFNPSSAGFMNAGELAISKYDSSCFRSILAKKNGAKTPFPEKLGEMGDKFEVLCGEWLAKKYPDWQIVREKVLKGPCMGNEDGWFSGREDFRLQKGKKVMIVECKSTVSKINRREVIRKGNMNPSQLAQLISYMVQERQSRGMMMIGYYHIDPETGEMVCEHAFRDMGTKNANFAVYRVEIKDDGTIEVNGNPFEFTVYDNINHRDIVIDILKTKEVGPRPADALKEYGGPCGLCDFRPVCDAFDVKAFSGEPMTSKEFIDECNRVASETEVREVKFFEPKRRRK